MQLTNIARDIGEDARNNRIYIPTDWMKRNGIAIDAFLKNPENFPEVSILVKQLLNKADYFYKRAGAGYFLFLRNVDQVFFQLVKFILK